MFAEKKKKPDYTKTQNKISNGTRFDGDVVSEGSLRIDGELYGNLDLKGKVVIGNSGYVNGKITCENADIEGKFVGKLTVTSCLNLKNTAEITGEVITDQLIVETGASFNATCQMSGNVKSLDNARKKSKKEGSKIA